MLRSLGLLFGILVSFCMKAIVSYDLSHSNTTVFNLARERLLNFTNYLESKQVPIEKRTLMIIHLGYRNSSAPKNLLEIEMNNVKIFYNSVLLDQEYKSGIFYWFNVISPRSRPIKNSFFPLINSGENSSVDTSPNEFNKAIALWRHTSSDIHQHYKTLLYLKDTGIEHKYGSIFFANNGVRGPLRQEKNGAWIDSFRNLLFNNNVGIVGATQSCIPPFPDHVQSHFFGIRANLLSAVVEYYEKPYAHKSWDDLIQHYEVGLTQLIQGLGYNISSLLHLTRYNETFFKACNDVMKKHYALVCDIEPDQLIFVKWGGTLISLKVSCGALNEQMKKELERTHSIYPNLDLVMPETI